MNQKHNQPPKHNDWNTLPLTTQIYITWRIFKKGHLPKLQDTLLKKLTKIDIWLFSPLTFITCYKAVSKLFPEQHPMSFIAIPGTAFMFTTLALLALRPSKKITAHWIKQH